MSFPKILHCLICEDLRLEKNRKASLLGFYGIAPNVTILIRNFETPLDRLHFLFVGTEGPGEFRVSFKIVDEENVTLMDLKEFDYVVKDRRRHNVGFGIANIKFSHPGKHTVQLYVDKKLHHEANFTLEQGQPKDFED